MMLASCSLQRRKEGLGSRFEDGLGLHGLLAFLYIRFALKIVGEVVTRLRGS